MQPLSGQLRFTAAGATHDLEPGQLLAAARGIPHAVASPTGATFVLTVSPSAPAGGPSRTPPEPIGRPSAQPPVGPEAWLRGPIEGISAVIVPAAHALVQARDDLHRAVADLTAEELWISPGGAASIGFHLRHIVGSLDRLLTYARGEALTPDQKAALVREGQPGNPPDGPVPLLAAVNEAVDAALRVLRATSSETLLDGRQVGRARLPTNLLGLLFHAAEHSQRHTGQVVTTAKIVRGLGLGTR